MSGRHELKVWPMYFDAIIRGDKLFELRGNDRDFQTGDTVLLREWDPKKQKVEPPIPVSLSSGFPAAPPSAPGEFTGRSCVVTITYVLRGGAFNMPHETTIFSFGAPAGYKNEDGEIITEKPN